MIWILFDFWVLRAIFLAGYRPRVISTEFNTNFGQEGGAICYEDPSLTTKDSELSEYRFKFPQCAWGVSQTALKVLAKEFGYSLIGRVESLDIFWIRSDLIKDCTVPTFESLADPRSKSLLHGVASVEHVKRLVDYEVYKITGSLDKAKAAALENLRKFHRNHPCFKAALDELKNQ